MCEKYDAQFVIDYFALLVKNLKSDCLKADISVGDDWLEFQVKVPKGDD